MTILQKNCAFLSIYSLFFLAPFISCNHISTATTSDKLKSRLEILKDQWNDSIDLIYQSDALCLTNTNEILNGIQQIKAFKQTRNVIQIDSVFLTDGSLERGIYYEIVTAYYSDSSVFKHLLITEKTADKPLIDFEFIAPTYGNKPDELESQISKQRQRWIELCNAHNAENLVRSVYTEDALYYNHKPLIKGWEAITADYDYMNRDSYHLVLNPLIVEFINEHLAYEIGQCEGTYGGKYILVWEKQEDGEWKICFDSNI